MFGGPPHLIVGGRIQRFLIFAIVLGIIGAYGTEFEILDGFVLGRARTLGEDTLLNGGLLVDGILGIEYFLGALATF